MSGKVRRAVMMACIGKLNEPGESNAELLVLKAPSAAARW